MIAPAPIELSEGRLYALCNPYEIDGRVSWHPPRLRGFAPMNCYLLVEGERALLIDSGVTVHRRALLEQLERVLPAGAELTVLHTRLGEYNSLCNTTAVAARFGVVEVCGPHVNAELWTDFEPHPEAGADGFGHAIEAPVRVIGNEQTLTLDPGDHRRVEVFAAALRLLPTHWAYDEATATLFTSDMFSHVHRGEAAGPWTVTAAEDPTTPEQVRSHMLETRYWWLPGAETGPIAAELEQLFASRPVARIAPGYGCILEGEAVVERHLEMVRGVLASEPAAALR